MIKTESALPAVRNGDAEAPALQMGDNAEQKIFLQPSAQSRFAPPQYYYPASRSGAVPSWAISGTQMGASRRNQQAQLELDHAGGSFRPARLFSKLILLLQHVELRLAHQALTLVKVDGEGRGIADLPLIAQHAQRDLHAVH
jgi:hypothetical protein